MRPIFKRIQNAESIPLEENRDAALPAAALFGVLTLTIMLFGLTVLYSTSFGIAGSDYFRKQLMWSGVGMGGLFAVLFFGYKKVSDLSPFLMIGIGLMLMIADFCFPAVKGAHRWIKIPGIGSIQPSEYAKLILALFLAKYLSERTRLIELHPIKDVFFKGAIFCGPVIALVLLGKDLGTTTLLTSLFFIGMFVAGVKIGYIVVPPLILAVGAFFYIKNFDAMRWGRMTVFMNPEEVQATSGYQLWHSLLALGSGGWTGVGFTESRMKMKYLPEAHTDFILSIVGEELGLICLILVIVAYLCFLVFAVRIASHARTRQGMLLAFLIAAFIGMQALINLGVICGAFPTKGMPAPFISYGGSNLVTCLTAAGLILSVALDSAYPDYHLKIRDFLKQKIIDLKTRFFGTNTENT